jgi:hypothetical protein
MFSSCALYYPTIDICDEVWLKNAYLFWDGIRTIVPQSLEGKAYHNNTSQFLEGEGYLQPILVNPSESVVMNLVSKVKRYAKSKEGIACLNQKVSFNDDSNPYSDDRAAFYLHSEKLPLVVQEMLEDKVGNDGWVRVSGNFANFYMTLLANDIANRKSLTLLTDTPTLANLTTKYSVNSFKPYLRAGVSASATCQSMLIRMIIDGIKIDPLTSIYDLRSFKEHHRDELNNFRNGLDEITSLNVPDGIDYEGVVQAVGDIYERKVKLAYNDLKAALKGAHINFLSDVSSLLYTGITTVVLDTLTNLSKPMQLLTGAGIYVAAKSIKDYTNKRNLKRACKMSYLLSIDKELGIKQM